MQTGLTQKVLVPLDQAAHSLKDLGVFPQEGHRPYVVTVINPATDPSGTASAATVYCGAELAAAFPLAVGYANDWYYIDPARFTISQRSTSTSQSFLIVDISGCDGHCRLCFPG